MPVSDSYCEEIGVLVATVEELSDTELDVELGDVGVKRLLLLPGVPATAFSAIRA